MSTQPQLSPLEQLAQSAPQQTAPASSSGLSPLEQLAQSSDTPPSGPTSAQVAYRQATASGPYTEPGAAERAMGQEMGNNADQARFAAKSTGQAALETAGGILGASAAPQAIEAAGSALRFLSHEYGQPAVEALKQAAQQHPVVAKVIGHALADMGVLGVAKWVKLFGNSEK